MLTAERILSNLPWIIIIWTSTSLAWGIYMGIAYTVMIAWIKHRTGSVRGSDMFHIYLMYGINAFLLSYLWFDYVLATVHNSILVVNVFYNLMLLASVFELLHWVKVKRAEKLVAQTPISHP